jgi:hypothetical protein
VELAELYADSAGDRACELPPESGESRGRGVMAGDLDDSPRYLRRRKSGQQEVDWRQRVDEKWARRCTQSRSLYFTQKGDSGKQ